MKIVIIIPAYNEERTIRQVVSAVLKESSLVIVIDDGSTDKTAQRAEEAGAKVYRHIINLGLGLL